MEFTGQAKKDFEKWLLSEDESVKFSFPYDNYCLSNPNPNDTEIIELFNALSESMQFGVRQAWLDSVKIYADVVNVNNCSVFFSYTINGVSKGIFIKREETRDEAIKKADELYNAQTSSTI